MAEGLTNTEEEDTIAQRQRLKAAFHYVIGCVYEDIAKETRIKVNQDVIAATTEMVYQQCMVLGTDLELFAKHAKRSTVTFDDLKLVCRRNSSLSQFINQEAEKLKMEKNHTKVGGATEEVEDNKKVRTKKRTAPVIIDD